MSNIIIAGSRSFKDYNLIKTEVDSFIKENNLVDIQILCGLAQGADMLGLKYGVENGYLVLQYPPNWNKHGKSAGIIRNREMANNSTFLIAFWDGNSKGTKHMINYATEKNLTVKVIKF